MNSIDLLSFNICGAFDEDKFQTALNRLPKEEHASVLRFKFERDQHLALGSLLLRRHYFSNRLKVPWHSLQFDRLPGGKPTLKNFDFENLDFNTSHEGNWVIFGAAKDIKIGIDAVCFDRPKNITSIASFIQSFESQLTQNEMHMIMDNKDEETRLSTFFELWGCKESYIKAIGVGLSLELNKLDFYNDLEGHQIKMRYEGQPLNYWSYHLHYMDEHTLAVVCYGGKDEGSDRKLEIEQFSRSTQLLGFGKPLHNSTKKDMFYQVKYQDLEKTISNSGSDSSS